MFKRLFVLAALASSAFAQECEELTTPQLCGTESVSIDLEECNSTSISMPQFKPCCRLQTEQARKCDDPDATQACRSMEISSGLCPGNSNDNCCFRKEMSMKLYFKFQTSNETCCSKCRCYGDPHCESFDGTPDTWIICDARDPQPTNRQRCPMSQSMCKAQLDHLGKPCNWTNPKNLPWNIGMLGSPCVFTQSDTPPFMVMYEAEGFKITLNQGERSVIKHLIIDDGPNKYVLGAEDCFASAYTTGAPTNPWREQVGGPAPNKPADWLPYKWTWGPLDGEDILWSVDNLLSLVDMTVRCTRTVEVVNGRRRYGPPRLNVDIVEPKNWKDADQRPNAGGFCPEGTITKQGSYRHTDEIIRRGWCTQDVEQIDIARLLCGEGTTNAGIDGCKLRWCQSPYSSGANRPTAVTQQCMSDISNFGWDTTWCSTFTLPLNNTQASQCADSALCRQCRNDMADFGWKAAIAKYGAGLQPSDDDCVTREDLPPDLLGFCTKGVRVQYYDRVDGEWVTQFAIPADKCLKNGFITITQELDAPLFENPMRIIQCSEPKGTCLTNKCEAEIGFTASIEVDVQTSEIETVYNLFTNGKLVCDPAFWSTPTECLGFDPEKMCPCPNRRLKALPHH